MPWNPKLYPENWDVISWVIKKRAKLQCEQCGIAEGMWRIGRTYDRPYKIILSVAHLNHDPSDNREENLRALCQDCHLCYDALDHGQKARQTKYRKRREAEIAAGQLELFCEDKPQERMLA